MHVILITTVWRGTSRRDISDGLPLNSQIPFRSEISTGYRGAEGKSICQQSGGTGTETGYSRFAASVT